MNHWKIMGAKSLAGVLTVGMLMGQPSILRAADAVSRTSEIPVKEETLNASEEKSAASESQLLDESEPGKSDADKLDPDKSDGDNPDPENVENSDEGGSDSGLSEVEVPSSAAPEEQEPSSKAPDGMPDDENSSSIVPGSDAAPDSSGIPESSGGEGSSLPEEEMPESSGSQIAPAGSEEDLPEVEGELEEIDEEEDEELEDETKVQAGKDFYTGQLKSQFHMVFAEDFGEVMEDIEKENFTRNGFGKEDDSASALLVKEDEKEDTFHAPNWKDIVAVYVLLQKQDGQETFYFDEDHKEAIAEAYARMNPVQTVAGEKEYISFTVEDYANQENLEEGDRETLERYSSRECLLLCAALTGARGLIEGTFGSEVSRERADIVAAAYSLVGKISYFFGGKSSAIGWDDRWGKKEEVTAEGSRSTGKTRKYGLDCSGYVTWSFINGYGKASASGKIGNGTSAQWYASRKIEENEEILPGDLVFLQGPEHSGINHVGLVVGVKENGDVIVAHCSSGHNGVVVQEASRAGFKYIRRPKCFADGDKEAEKILKQEKKRIKKGEEKLDSPYISREVKVKLLMPADEEAEEEQESQEENVFGSIQKDEEQPEEMLIPNLLQNE